MSARPVSRVDAVILAVATQIQWPLVFIAAGLWDIGTGRVYFGFGFLLASITLAVYRLAPSSSPARDAQPGLVVPPGWRLVADPSGEYIADGSVAVTFRLERLPSEPRKER